jgi:hypothetical protein
VKIKQVTPKTISDNVDKFVEEYKNKLQFLKSMNYYKKNNSRKAAAKKDALWQSKHDKYNIYLNIRNKRILGGYRHEL